MKILKQAVLASAVTLFAALSVTSASASVKTCYNALAKCNAACSKRPIGQDVCYKKCERSFMQCD